MTGRHPQRVLLLAMYPLDRGLWGATARITQMRAALASLTRLEVVSGTRGRRAWALARFVSGGRLRGLSGVYVENATTLPGPADIAFVGCARLFGVPVISYVRDAQQLFPEYYHATTVKRRLSRALFLPLTRLLIRLSSRATFPSQGLATAVTGRSDEALLPPGARLAAAPPLDPAARTLLFVGGLRVPAHGGEILLEGTRLARERGHLVELLCVTRPGEEPAEPMPPWARVVHAEGDGIDELLPGVLASITPRRRTPYNDLAVPIKVMEYLGYGRPLIVTDATEQARIVREAECGVVVPDTAEGIADGIGQVANADPHTLVAWGRAAVVAAEANSWESRARRVLELLEAAA